MSLKSLENRILSIRRKYAENHAREALKAKPILWATLQKYLDATKSTGCSYSDYKMLYDYVRKHKPTEILECGTGVSTIIIAQALEENHAEGALGRVTSLEDQEPYFLSARKLIPDKLAPFINLCLQPRKEYCFSFYRGVGYDNLPEIPYEFVFIDGPSIVAPSDGTKTFDFDFLNVLKKSTQPVSAILDKRYTTAYVFQNILGKNQVRYDPVSELSFIGPCTKNDIRVPKGSSSPVFSHSIRFNGPTHFRLDIESEPRTKKTKL